MLKKNPKIFLTIVGEGTPSNTLLENKLNVAGKPRYCTNKFTILRELIHDFPIFA